MPAQIISACLHDFENVLHTARATWVCPKCGEDVSIQYLFWYEAARIGKEKK